MTTLEQIYQHSPIWAQNIMLNGKALSLYFERYGKKFDRQFEEFNRIQYLSADDIESYQNEKLRRLIRHAYNTVPYYNRLFNDIGIRPDDVQTSKDLVKIPVLTKKSIKNNFHHLISTDYNPSKLRKGHTSGTTGTPLNILYDIETCVVHHAADRRQKEWAGMKWGEAYASIQGRVIVPQTQKRKPFWRKNHINNQLFLSAFHLKKENIPYYFEKLNNDGIRFIEGYPSTLYALASYLNSTHQTFELKAVLTSSETLFEWQRTAIEKAFKCKIFDFYGMAERVVYATECSAHEGHHINPDYGITEFIGGDGAPVARGEAGKIIATSLHNFAFPLIRYQTNDSCALKTAECSCGRAFPLMDDVATKDEAIITLPDGRLISPSVLTHPFKPMVNIEASQILQKDLHNIIIHVVRGPLYTDWDEKLLLEGFTNRIGDGINLKVVYVNEIEKTKNGKLKWVTSNVEAKF
jgi:phenylacetate-CoA ligase